MVAIDNKIEQAMVSGITESFPIPRLSCCLCNLGQE